MRYDHYKVPEVESFMINILEKKERVEPVFDLKLGYHYPDVEEVIKLNPSKTIDFLEQLCNVEILEKEKFDMETRCPKCNSPSVSTKYVCPHCGSNIIKRTLLIEHFKCGFLGSATSFGEPLVCPKCGEQVAEGDYRNAGSVYECAQCQRQIETPFIEHWCRECSFAFSLENAFYEPAFAYLPSELTKREIERGILYLSQVADVFNEYELQRESDTRISGNSGTQHYFDIIFSQRSIIGSGKKFLVDVFFFMDPMVELDLLKEYAKINDVSYDTYVIVLPGLEEKAESIAKSSAMNIIQATNPESAIKDLKESLKSKMEKIKKEKPTETKKEEKKSQKDEKKSKSAKKPIKEPKKEKDKKTKKAKGKTEKS